jgi:hypothetical protein
MGIPKNSSLADVELEPMTTMGTILLVVSMKKVAGPPDSVYLLAVAGNISTAVTKLLTLFIAPTALINGGLIAAVLTTGVWIGWHTSTACVLHVTRRAGDGWADYDGCAFAVFVKH